MKNVKTEVGGDDMLALKEILVGIVRSEVYESAEAKQYYDKLTKVRWNAKSIELYEESLNRESFIAHNTVLTIFTDMDKGREEEIDEVNETEEKEEKDMISNKDNKKLEEMTNSELKGKLSERGLVYKVKDNKATLIKLLTIDSKFIDRKKVKDVKDKETIKHEEIGIKKADDIDIKKERVFGTEEILEKLMENATLHELIDSVCTIGTKIFGAKAGGKLLKRLNKVMEEDFDTWYIIKESSLKEKNRTFDNITKVGKGGKKSTDKGGKQTSTEADKILRDLKGKKLTKELISGIPWRTLKKLAKERGVESFGKSKKFITKGLLKNAKK